MDINKLYIEYIKDRIDSCIDELKAYTDALDLINEGLQFIPGDQMSYWFKEALVHLDIASVNLNEGLKCLKK